MNKLNKMELLNYHQYQLRIQSLFFVSLFISFSTAETVTTADTLNIVELNVKLTSLTTIVETLMKESKLNYEELKIRDQRIEVLQKRVSDLEGRKDMQADVKQENVNPEHLMKRLDNYQNGRNMEMTHRIHKRVPELPPVKVYVAFSASLSHNIAAQYNAIIKFDHILLDTANAYNSNTGVFTAPEAGIYVLTWTTSVDHTSWAYTSLMVNGQSVGHTISDTEEVNDNHSATGTFVIQLATGDYVNVQFKPNTNKGNLDTHWGLNSFSGWKLD